MTLPPITLVDFECRSFARLKGKERTSGRRYAEHPSTEVICAVLRCERACMTEAPMGERLAAFAMPGGRGNTWDQIVWWPGDEEPTPCGAFVAVAHNATGFDRHVWRVLGWPGPVEWIDTTEAARVGGFPEVSLDALILRFAGRHKDIEGNALTLSLSKPVRRKGQAPRLPDITPAVRQRVSKYCCQDIQDTAEIMPHVWAYLDNDLPGIREADRAIIDRGLLFDVEGAELLLRAFEHLADAACARAGVTQAQVRSNPQFHALMSDAGWPLENAQAKTLDDLIEALNAGGNVSGADLVRVRALIVARQETVSNAPGKLRAACQRVSPDGRLRDAVKYAGAHTLRWAGVGFQPQNLTIGCTDDDVKAALG